MPRLVRRTPLLERIKARLDPYDLLLWLAEELNNDAYDEWLKDWATVIGIGCNILFILARGASRRGVGRGKDDVFGEMGGRGGSGWFAWLAAFLVYVLALLCCLNALYTFFRKRHYRLFEQPVDAAPATPSAHRVRVDSSPVSSSPLRYLQTVLSANTASSRAYPDAEREVWELSMWDPKPFHLTLFTLFSPGHLLLYFSLLPPAPLDPRPSVTVLTAMGFGALLSLQLSFLKISFSQQAKDATLVHGEVMNEYDTKFVRPALNRPVRDVGTQTLGGATQTLGGGGGSKGREVDVYTPTTIIKRGFRTNPNPNYASQYDPDNLSETSSRRTSNVGISYGNSNNTSTTSLTTPTNPYAQSNGYTSQAALSRPTSSHSIATGTADFSSPLKPHHEQPHHRERVPALARRGNGGHLGVYTHAASPLRKAASSSQLTVAGGGEQQRRREGSSPLKRMSTPGGVDAGARRRETLAGRY